MKMTVGAARFRAPRGLIGCRGGRPCRRVVLGVKGSPFYQALACGAKAKAKELGLALTVSAPDQFAADSQIPVVNADRGDHARRRGYRANRREGANRAYEAARRPGNKDRDRALDQTIEDSSFVQT